MIHASSHGKLFPSTPNIVYANSSPWFFAKFEPLLGRPAVKRVCALCTSLFLIVALTSTPAFALIAMYIESQVQGQITGDITFPSEESNIGVTGFSSSVYMPYDPASGQATGRRQYSPIIINKSFDSASIRMNLAFLATEQLNLVRLHFYKAESQGQSVHYYTVELQNARIVSYDQTTDDTAPVQETWGFTFQRIMWIDEINNLETTDNWADVVAAVLPPGPSDNLTLLPPLPNPTDASSVIRFDLPLDSHATLDVYDLKGRRIARLFDRSTDHARTVVRWDGRDSSGSQVANGLYLVRLRSPQGEVTQRVTFMR